MKRDGVMADDSGEDDELMIPVRETWFQFDGIRVVSEEVNSRVEEMSSEKNDL